MLTRLRLGLLEYQQALALRHKAKNVEHRDWRHAFLHIGKNAGSTIGDFLLELSRSGRRAPVVLGHDWTLPLMARRYPRMKMSFVLRDPLERVVSGFNSRLRQGRPRNQNLWQPNEAIAFAHFRSVEEFFAACVADDEHRQSAARFARANIQHVRDGYVHHFGSLDMLRRHRHRIHCVGQVDDIDAFLGPLLRAVDIDYETVRHLLAEKHRAPVASSSVLASCSPGELERLKRFFADEYEIHGALAAMVRS